MLLEREQQVVGSGGVLKSLVKVGGVHCDMCVDYFCPECEDACKPYEHLEGSCDGCCGEPSCILYCGA